MPARAILLAIAFVLGATSYAAAGTIQISPTRLELNKRGSSAIFTLTNSGVQSMRIQAKTFAWEQSVSGEQVLKAAPELVVFPTLFTLAPGESRRVKIGITIEPGARERSYRLIVDELPGPTAIEVTGLRVLTRMSVPIFQAPKRLIRAGAVSQVALRDGTLSIDVMNQGTVNVMLKAAKATCKDVNDKIVWEGEASGWYLLAGGKRSFELKVPPEKANGISSVEVEATTDKDSWKRRVSIERK